MCSRSPHRPLFRIRWFGEASTFLRHKGPLHSLLYPVHCERPALRLSAPEPASESKCISCHWAGPSASSAAGSAQVFSSQQKQVYTSTKTHTEREREINKSIVLVFVCQTAFVMTMLSKNYQVVFTSRYLHLTSRFQEGSLL